MTQLWLLAVWIHYGLVVISVATVLRRRREPTAMIAWILAIVFLPVVGMLAYWLLASNRLRRKARRRRRRVAHLLRRLREQTVRLTVHDESNATPALPDDLASVERLGRRLAEVPAVGGNAVTVYTDGEASFAALEEAIRNASHHVHLEYYIWRDDATGRALRDLVAERARAGVECRVLLDAVGCWKLPRAFLRPLLDAGAAAHFFLPLRPFPLRKRWSLHLRNHRKLAVCDGQMALLGSQNVGDEYRGRDPALSPWFDVQMMMTGPAALFVQQTFAEDWYLAAREQLDRDVYFPPPVRPGTTLAQVLSTGPDQPVSTLTQVIFAAVSAARDSIRIATPYFVPDPAVRMALASACYRGVRVRLVLPTRSDVALVLWAARSFYAELLDAGVEVYEYDAGVLHSKVVVVDDRWALLGSANMDVRSFRLNFEITGAVYDHDVAQQLGEYVERFCAKGRRVQAAEVWRKSLVRQLGEGAARLFAPLL